MSEYDINSSFGNLINLLNQIPSVEILNESFSKYLSHNISIHCDDDIALAGEMVKFLNALIPLMGDDIEKNKNTINLSLKRLKISNSNVNNEDILDCLCNQIENFKKKKFTSNLSSFDWQINVIDRKNDNMNLNKAEKVEIVAKINSFNSQNQQYESNIVKMNYNEFQEILNNFKKIDGQLHLFKQ